MQRHRGDSAPQRPSGRRFHRSQASRRRDGIGPMFAQSDVATRWLVGPIVLGAIVIGTLPARTDVVSYPANSHAALLIRNGGRVVASTTGTVFVRAADDRLFECAIVGGTRRSIQCSTNTASNLAVCKRSSFPRARSWNRRCVRYRFLCSPCGFCAEGAEGYDRRVMPWSLPPCTRYALRDQHTLRSQKPPGKIDPSVPLAPRSTRRMFRSRM
jgi:hypothetical protein